MIILWRHLRSGSKTDIWKDPVIRKRFSRYYDLIHKKKTARYLIAKRFGINVTALESIDTSELWDIHKIQSKKFNELLFRIDQGKQDYNELETPEISYLNLKMELANRIIQACELCEHQCKVNRLNGETGKCRLTNDSYVSSVFLHHGEEPPLVPSGTIFFNSCNFRCAFCQNYSISQKWIKQNKVIDGTLVTPTQLASYAQHLAREGARNINWVGGDPTPNTHNILQALNLMDRNICILWNSNMYMTTQTTILLLDIMDFWLPDLKYYESSFAKKISMVDNYWDIITRNIKAAHDEGSGEMIIRHLVMPGRVDNDTKPILEWCASSVPNALINVMGQYRPEYQAKHDSSYTEIRRRPSTDEMQKAYRIATELGIIWEPVS